MVRRAEMFFGDDAREHLGTIYSVSSQMWLTERGAWTRALSRVLVLLTTLLLLAMPVTEHLCNWDRFLRGGPDVEFSVLAWLLFAAMVVLSMHGTMLRPNAMQPGTMKSPSDTMRRARAHGTSQKTPDSRARTHCGLLGSGEFLSISNLHGPLPLRI